MSAESQLESYLQAKFEIAVLTANQQKQDMTFSEPFTAWEAAYFLRGVRDRLFIVDDRGYAQSEVLPPPAGKSKSQKMLQLFWSHGNGKRGLFREGVNQLATASSTSMVGTRMKFEWNQRPNNSEL